MMRRLRCVKSGLRYAGCEALAEGDTIQLHAGHLG